MNGVLVRVVYSLDPLGGYVGMRRFHTHAARRGMLVWPRPRRHRRSYGKTWPCGVLERFLRHLLCFTSSARRPRRFPAPSPPSLRAPSALVSTRRLPCRLRAPSLRAPSPWRAERWRGQRGRYGAERRRGPRAERRRGPRAERRRGSRVGRWRGPRAERRRPPRQRAKAVRPRPPGQGGNFRLCLA